MTDSPVSAISRTTPFQESEVMKGVVATIKTQLDVWNNAYDNLIRQTGQIGMLGGDQKSTKVINNLRNAMKAQEHKNEAAVNDVRDFLVKELQTQVEADLRQLIEKAVDAQLNEIVQEQVAASLETHIPQNLQDELANDKTELDKLQRQLHNSESRRKNGLLKATDQRSPLQTIYKPNGEISLLFPKTLIAMSKLDAETANALVSEYLHPEVPGSRQVVSALSAGFDIFD